MIKNIPWSIPMFGKEEKQAVDKVLKSGWLSQGIQTELLEKKIAKFINAKYVVVTNNGTSALISALLANDIKPSDEVIVPSLTFVASVNAVLAIGAKPILVDCDPRTFNTNVQLIKKNITRKTKAIMPVDISGMPVDIFELKDFCAKKNLVLIEDAAQAIGAEYQKKKIGSFGHSTIFSFHIAKVLTSIEGGCVVTNDKLVAEKLKLIRSHGDTGNYSHKIYGLNFRISDLHSAIAVQQIKKIKLFLKHRQKLAKFYKNEISNVEFQHIPDYVTFHPYMLFGILVTKNKRNYLRNFLSKNGVDTRICFPPIYSQKYQKGLVKKYHHPGSELVYSKIINLPIGNGLTENDIHYVIKKVKTGLKNL